MQTSYCNDLNLDSRAKLALLTSLQESLGTSLSVGRLQCRMIANEGDFIPDVICDLFQHHEEALSVYQQLLRENWKALLGDSGALQELETVASRPPHLDLQALDILTSCSAQIAALIFRGLKSIETLSVFSDDMSFWEDLSACKTAPWTTTVRCLTLGIPYQGSEGRTEPEHVFEKSRLGSFTVPFLETFTNLERVRVSFGFLFVVNHEAFLKLPSPLRQVTIVVDDPYLHYEYVHVLAGVIQKLYATVEEQSNGLKFITIDCRKNIWEEEAFPLLWDESGRDTGLPIIRARYREGDKDFIDDLEMRLRESFPKLQVVRPRPGREVLRLLLESE